MKIAVDEMPKWSKKTYTKTLDGTEKKPKLLLKW